MDHCPDVRASLLPVIVIAIVLGIGLFISASVVGRSSGSDTQHRVVRQEGFADSFARIVLLHEKSKLSDPEFRAAKRRLLQGERH